jgi:hypothetical protein
MKNMKKILYKQKTDLKGDILSRHLVSLRYCGIFSRIGFSYLLSDKFVYIPPKSGFFKKLTIQYSDIEKIDRYKKTGINICKIYLKSNKVKSFIMENDAFNDDIVKFAGNPVFKNIQVDDDLSNGGGLLTACNVSAKTCGNTN